MKSWEKKKSQNSRHKKKESKNRQPQLFDRDLSKKHYGEQAFTNWLKGSLKKLKTEKRMQKEKKKEDKQIKDRQVKIKVKNKILNDINYKEWVQKKDRVKKLEKKRAKTLKRMKELRRS